MRVVATAGHVDHGKSSLVLALTGTDPDRFPEEKARGLTIDLGFAFATLPSGEEIGFVDVPGHVRFIKNMLAGVGAVDVVLLVVAANEGWMPQSEEHLRIVELLGVTHALVALTKADTVDDELVELARLELDEHLAGSLLADAPVVVCDSVSGRGVDAVRAALDSVLAGAPAPRDARRPRLWIDRVFAAKGAGTVVTGTLTGGSLAIDDQVVVGRDAHPARVRGIETAHRKVELVAPGTRVALNLAGVDHGDLRRGDAVVVPGDWTFTDAVDVALHPLRGVKMTRRGVLHCHVGSGEHEGRVRALDPDRRFGRLRLSERLPLAPGDRIVLRDPGRRRTVGGAEVLDVEPSGRAADAPARLALPLGARLLGSHPWLPRKELGRLSGQSREDADALARDLVDRGAATAVGDWLVAVTELSAVHAAVTERARAHHRSHPLEPGVDVPAVAAALRLTQEQVRAALERAADLVVEHGVIRHRSHRGSATGSPEAERLLDQMAPHPFAPLDPRSLGADPALVRSLLREGMLVDLDGVVFTAAALADARARVVDALRAHGTLTVADVRDLLGSTRKYVLPIVNRLDREGVTRRRGDDRVPGPGSGLL